VSTPGGHLLRVWCRQPSVDVEVLHHRHDAVAFMMRALATAPEAVKELRAALKVRAFVAKGGGGAGKGGGPAIREPWHGM
jgi:hypothetical protein